MWHHRSASVRRAVLAALALSIGSSASAEDRHVFDSIRERLGTVEARIEQVTVGLGLRKPERPVVDVQFGGQSAGQITVRMDTLEAQMRQLTGQVEQLMFQVRQVDERLRRFAEDAEFRFRDLSGGRPAGGPPTRPRSETSPPGAPTVVQSPTLPPSQVAAPPAAPIPSGTPAEAAPGGVPPQVLGQLPSPPPSASAPATEATGRPLDLAALIRNNGVLDAPSGVPPVAAPLPGVPGGQLVVARGTTPKEDYDLAYGYILRQDYELAEAAFGEFLARYPDDQLTGNARFWLGEAQYQRGKYRDAADAYLKVYTQHASSAKAADSLVKLGASLRQLMENEAACAALAEFARKFPKPPAQLKQQAQQELQRAGCS